MSKNHINCFISTVVLTEIIIKVGKNSITFFSVHSLLDLLGNLQWRRIIIQYLLWYSLEYCYNIIINILCLVGGILQRKKGKYITLFSSQKIPLSGIICSESAAQDYSRHSTGIFFVYTVLIPFLGAQELKGAVSRDLLEFFHESNPPGSLINRLKWFCRKIRFREDFRIFGSKNLTRRSDSQCRVTYFANISAKTNLSGKQFYSVFSVF